ncbi:MAG: transglutaminase-like domain-containing protein [Candidatus Entotheonellia bacterium]
MPAENRSRPRLPLPISELLQVLGPAFGIGLFVLTPQAYWWRLRQGRSPLAQTFYERRRILPRASLDSRNLSHEIYLRPTPYCDSHAPEIVALADDFRQRAANDWEYAQAIYDFVRNDIVYTLEPLSGFRVVATLRAGGGACLDKLNVFVALARAGGIPTRYCTVGNVAPLEFGKERPRLEVMNRYLKDLEAEADWSLKKLGASFSRLVQRLEKKVQAGNSFEMRFHPMAELKIGDFWIPADVTWGDAEAAAQNLPLPRFGYDPLTLRRYRGSVVNRSEQAPIGRSYWIVRCVLCLLARGLVDHLNHTVEGLRAQGRQLLAEMGQDEYVRRQRRFYVPVPGAAQLGLSLRA